MKKYMFYVYFAMIGCLAFVIPMIVREPTQGHVIFGVLFVTLGTAFVYAVARISYHFHQKNDSSGAKDISYRG